jgi:phosphoketolase
VPWRASAASQKILLSCTIWRQDHYRLLATADKPIIFNFHSYPCLIHKLAYRFTVRRPSRTRLQEKGNINTPLELVILTQVGRLNLLIDVLDRQPRLHNRVAHLKERLKSEIILDLTYAQEHVTHRAEITEWLWPGLKRGARRNQPAKSKPSSATRMPKANSHDF